MHDPKSLLHDPSLLRLGKKAVRHDDRTLQLAKYLGSALPPPPASLVWSTKTDNKWPMFMNDSLGDCTCASAAHMEQLWSAAGIKSEITVADADVLAMYEGAAGYNPKDPSTDQGAVELDVLKFWQKTGLAGRKIGPYASVSVQSKTITKDGIYLFGGIYTGFALPVSAQSQAVWDVPARGAVGRGAPGSWGGHAVPVIDYDVRGLTCVTWGALKRMTWAFYQTYCDEAYAILSPDFLSAGKSPAGFDAATLAADLAKLH